MADASGVPCVIYAAKSTEDKHGSIPTQIEDCRAMAEREGWEVVGEPFEDEGFSAFKGNRGPGLEAAKAAAVAAAKQHGEALLVAQHSDRIARGAGDAPDAADHLVEVVSSLRRQNVVLRTVQDDFFADDRMGLLMAALQGQRNTEDSARKSEAVASGKDRQLERGQRLGGPVPDGLRVEVERDEADRVIAKRYVRDPERAPIVERAFDLSEEGHGDPAVARALNAEGHRTKSGKAFYRRRVQNMLKNQVYAGRVVRTGKGSRSDDPARSTYRKLDEPEVSPASNIEPLIEPARYDRIMELRKERDKVGPEARKRGGRPTRRYALAKLAICDRCGERMYVSTSPYKRKSDGKHRRSYICSNVKFATGTCDQPKLDAEKVDTAIVAYLDEVFVDFDAWLEQLTQARDVQRDAAQAALDRATKEAQKLDKLAAKVRADYLKRLDAGEDSAARIAADALDDLSQKAEALTAEAATHQQLLDLMEEPVEDSLLDAYNGLAKAVRGEGDDDNLADLNERLRAHFQEFRLDQVDDDVIGVMPVLRRVETPPTINVGESFAAWEEAGCPEPTEEEVEEYERLSRNESFVSADGTTPADLPPHVPALIWATGRDVIRPPAKALTVTGIDTHE